MMQVWEATLDNRYHVTVERARPYQGVLQVWSDAAHATLLHSAAVGLSYDARFGPDYEDVCEWERIAADFVDGIITTPEVH